MRVTFLLPLRPQAPIGGFRVVYEYANGLAALGHDVEVVHPARLRQHRQRPPLQPLPLARFVRRWLSTSWLHIRRRDRGLDGYDLDPRVVVRFVSTLAARHIRHGDAVIATAWETAEYAGSLPRDRGVGFYLIQHYEDWSGTQAQVDNTWRLPLHKIVIADWLLDRARELGLSDVVHIPNAIDSRQFHLTKPVEGRPPRVAMLYSTWHEWKGTSVGLEALRLAKEAVPELGAVLFGVGSPPAQTPPWVEVHTQPTAEVLVDDVYNGSSIYLCPSFGEGWHLPPAEAMACGCAVVSTDIGGVRDYARHGHNALLVPLGDPQALADAVVLLATDDALRVRLAQQAVLTMATFNWERSVAAFERYLLDNAEE